jgi:phosphopantothenoylcysteine decarboxylase / phosphopantothenate---cysteine ligase
VVNDVAGGGVFGRSRNAVTILDAGGGSRVVPEGTKEEIADAVWDVVADLWTHGRRTPDAPVE